MAAADALLRITIVADAAKAAAGLDQAKASTSKWSSGLNKASAVAAVGLAAVGKVMLDGAKAAAEDAQGQAVLANALKNAAGATDAQVSATEDWISKTTLATGVADDQLRPALATLARATGDVSKAQEGMGLALDIAAATGKDVESVSMALAKAYAGNTASLGKLVPGLDAATLASKDMNAITKDLAGLVGGAAQASANTAAGQYQRFQVAIAETKEGIGAALLPVLNQLTGLMRTVASWAANNTKVITVLLGVFSGLAAIVLTVNAVTKAYVAISKIVKVATLAWSVAQRALNLALAMNPIGLVVLAIAALVAGLVLAWTRSATFRRIVTGAFNAVLGAAKAVWGWIKSNWPLLLAILLGPFGLAVGVIIRNFDTIKSAAQSVFNVIKGIFEKISSAISTITNAIKKIPKPSIPDLNPFAASSAGVTPITLGATRLAGVARAPAATSRGSGGISVTVNGALDPESVARQLRAILVSHSRRVGSLATL